MQAGLKRLQAESQPAVTYHQDKFQPEGIQFQDRELTVSSFSHSLSLGTVLSLCSGSERNRKRLQVMEQEAEG